MKNLFAIAEVLTLKIIENIKELSFEKVELTYTSLSITFGMDEKKIIFSLSIHPLDFPWQITTHIKKKEKEIGSVEKIIDVKYNYETNPRYEITPLFLADTKNKLNGLVDLIIIDIRSVLPKINSI